MKKKRLVSYAPLLLLVVVLSMAALEQAYRFYVFGTASLSIEKMNSLHNMGVSGLIRASDHSEIVYELKPNLDTYFKLARFKTNSQGLRDKEYSLSKPRDVFRVAVIGDSFTMPAGVEIEEAFHSLLEEKLNGEKGGKTYQFINFGVGGYNLRQYVGVMKLKAQAYDPDLILVCLCASNDHEIPRKDMFDRPYEVKPVERSFFRSFVKTVLSGVWSHMRKKPTVKKAGRASDDQKEYVSRIFSEMKAHGEENGTPIVLVNVDYRYKKRYVNELRELAVANGLDFTDVSRRFETDELRQYRIYATDFHPNGKANRIFAEELYEYLGRFLDAGVLDD